jgi:cryptochrome
VFPKIFKAWNVTHLVFEKDTDDYPRERDQAITDLAKQAGVQVISPYGRTLWDSDDVVAQNGGKPTMSITQLQTAGRKVGKIPRPIPAPKHLPDPGEMPVDFATEEPDTSGDLNAPQRAGEDKAYTGIAGPNRDFAIETLEELGFPAATTPHRGGETLALKALDHIIADEQYAATFRKPQTSPAAFLPQSTTLLSAHLHFGSLSPRLFYWRVQDLVDRYKGASTPPESLTSQLLFRDMYFAAQAAIGPSFVQTLGNPHVRFVPWHLPSQVEGPDGGTGTVGNTTTRAASGAYHVDSAQADRWFRRWRAGTTGFPWIDALMRQLRTEGWIHHLGRHSLACFLTRGGCYVHWERGADVFEELLLDHEPACNAGNWQWLSCTAFFAQYYRCYSPVAFGRKWDPEGAFVRRYVPELRDLDSKYIYEPWKTPASALAKAGVRIEGDGLDEEDGEKKKKKSKKGGDSTAYYPEPMFDFNERRSACIGALKTAYAIGLHGNDEKVKDRSWRKLFQEAGETEMEEEEHLVGSDLDDNGEHADDAEHAAHKKGAKRAVKKQGPMDKHVKRPKP